MERYLMYLRKSRMDTDFDEVSVEDASFTGTGQYWNVCRRYLH